jgi:hypothetical protein
MQMPLALGLVVFTSSVCGVALWPSPAGAARSAPVARAAPAAADASLPAGGEVALARAVLVLLAADQQQRAIVGEHVHADVMLARPVAPNAIAVGRGIAVSEFAPVPRALVSRLLAHAATTWRGTTNAAPNAASVDHVHFACAGAIAGSGPFYVRLHGDDFAVEWFAGADGKVHGAWRGFAADSGRPWLRDAVFAAVATNRR